MWIKRGHSGHTAWHHLPSAIGTRNRIKPQHRQRACQLSLRYYLYTQLSCGALILFTVALWLLDWWQLAATSTTLLLFYSLIASPLCLFGMYRLQQKVRQKTAELAHLNALAEDFS